MELLISRSTMLRTDREASWLISSEWIVCAESDVAKEEVIAADEERCVRLRIEVKSVSRILRVCSSSAIV